MTFSITCPEGFTVNTKSSKLGSDFTDYISITKGQKFVLLTSDGYNVTETGELLKVSFDISDTVTAGKYPIGIEWAGDNSHADEYEKTVPVSVNAGSITVGTPKSDFPTDIALGTKEVTYDGEAHSFTEADITGNLPEGTAVNFENNSATDAGEYTVKATLKADGYNDKTIEGKIKINPKELTVTGFDAIDKIYDGTDVVTLKPGTLTGVVDGDDVTHVVPQNGRAASKNVGIVAITFDPITLTGADAGNYTLKQPVAMVEIKAKEVDVTVEDVTKYVGEAKAAIIANYDAADLIPDDTVTLTGEPACAVDINADGNYPITVGTLAFDNSNYVVKFKGGTYTVLPKSAQNSTVTGYVDVTYGHEGFTLEIDPYIDGGKYTIDNKTPNVVSVDNDGKVTILNAGDAKLDVVFEGNTQYNPQTVPVEFNVAKREIGFTADSVEVKVGEAEKTLTYKVTTGKFGYSDEAVVVLERQPGTAVGEYAITFKSVTIKNDDGRDVTSNYTYGTFPGVYKIVDKNIQQVTVTAPEDFKYGENTTAKIEYVLDEAAKADGCTTVTFTPVSVEPAGCMTVDNDGNISVNGAGTATFTVKVNGSTNYAEFTKNVTLTVAKREITVVPAAGQFKYEGKDDPAEFGYTTTGDSLVDGDVWSGQLGRVTGEEAGTYDFTLGTLAVNNNYKLTLDTTNKFEIKAAASQTVSFPTISPKTYGDADFDLGVRVTSYEGAKASYDSSNKSVATVDADGKVTILAAGDTDITVTVPASEDGEYAAYTMTRKLTVNKVTLTVTPDAGQWKYVGQDDPDFTYTVTGNFVGDDTEATVISGKLTRAAGDAIGQYDYKLDSLTATANYKLTLDNTNKFEIKDKLATTVTLASAVSKTYGDAAFNVGAAITASKDGATASYVSDNTNVATVDANGNVTIVGAGTAKITVTVAGDEEYKDYTGTQTVTVGKKNITVTAIATGKRVDTADPELTYNNTGLAYDDQFTGKLVRDAGEAIKDYDIKQGTLKIVGADGTTDKSANYNLTFAGAKFTISDKLPQSVTVPAVPTKTYGDEPFSVKATIVTSYGGASAKYASSNTAVATVDNDGNVTILAAGTADITVTVDGNDDYAKFELKQPLTVNKKQITVTPDSDQWKRIGKADPALTYTYDESLLVGDDVITGELGRAAGEELGEYAYTLGTLTAGANYELVLGGDAKFEIKDKMEQDVEMPELPDNITYGTDKKLDFKPTKHPIENHSIRYETSDDNVAYVDENGDLVFAGAGEAEITVIIEGNDDYKPYTETFEVKVNKKQIKITDFDPVTKEITFEGVEEGEEVGLDEEVLEVEVVNEITDDGKTRIVVTFSNLQADNNNYEAVIEYYDDPSTPPTESDEPAVNTWEPFVIEADDESERANALKEQIVTVKVDSPFGKVTRNGEVVEDEFDTLIGITETLSVVPNTGYMFTFWSYDGVVSTDTTVKFLVEDNMTVRAAFTEIHPESIVTPEFTVIFESNGGTYIPSVKVEIYDRVERPEDPVRDGYIFDGWYSDIYLDEKFNFKTEIEEFTVLFAKWIKVEEPEVPVTPVEPEVPAEPEWQNPFTDVNPADWFYSVVEYVNYNGIMNGVDATLFAPNGQVTRAMFVTMLYRLEGEPAAQQSVFTDVELNAWYAAAINWASANGIVNGISETEFAPNAAITREQMAAILYRYAQYKNYDVAVKDTTLAFTDADAISDYAMTAIVWAVENGLMQGNGDNTVAPKNAATRAEAAAVLMRAIENIK